MSQKNSKWIRNNHDYWNKVSPNYDSLYDDEWSALENAFIMEQLNGLINKTPCRVLDLGCGTGLGYGMCLNLNPDVDYIGIDLSPEMLAICKKQHPEIATVEGTMSDLSCFEPNSFDVIISVFTAFSYTDNVQNTIYEIARVLKPNGRIFISGLGKWSLRRIVKGKFQEKEKYTTRGSKTNLFACAWVFSQKSLSQRFAVANFIDISVRGYNSFAGISFLSRHPKLWNLNKKVSKTFPFLSHEIILTAKINK